MRASKEERVERRRARHVAMHFSVSFPSISHLSLALVLSPLNTTPWCASASQRRSSSLLSRWVSELGLSAQRERGRSFPL